LSSPESPQPQPHAPDSAESPILDANGSESAFSGTVLPPVTSEPAENPVWNGWDVLLIIGLTLATIFVSQFAILFGAHYLFYPHSSLMELAQRPLLLLISQYVIDLAVVIYLLLLIEGKYRAPFGSAIRWRWPRNAWGLLLLGAFMLLVLSMVENLLPMPKDTPFDKLFASPRDAYLIAIIAVSLGPLVEELFFRGFLYPVLARRTGVLLAIVFTAIPFGFMHYLQYRSWGAVLVITMVGVVLTSVRAITNSVAASFMVHVGYNATLMVLTAIATDGFRHMEKMSVALW
jgi:membrane protease YdiL (CAAX protease family)